MILRDGITEDPEVLAQYGFLRNALGMQERRKQDHGGRNDNGEYAQHDGDALSELRHGVDTHGWVRAFVEDVVRRRETAHKMGLVSAILTGSWTLRRASFRRNTTLRRSRRAGTSTGSTTTCSGPASRPEARPFTIVIPPPNITGKLHFGHALNNTLQDILVRWKRMQGYDALWLPGDGPRGHRDADGRRARPALARDVAARPGAREVPRGGLAVEGEARRGDPRDAQAPRGVVRLVSRTRFTLDEGLSRAVREVFVSLYEDGLIYRGEDLINWCPRAGPRCRTSRSRSRRARAARCGRSRYPLADGSGRLVVATTRPGDDARRHGGRRASRRRALPPPDRQGGHPAADRTRDPDRRRRDPRRSGVRDGRGQGHARARLQRLRDGASATSCR